MAVGQWRLVDTDPLSGIECWYKMEPDGKILIKHHEPDVSPLLDRNKALQNHDDRGYGADRERWLRRAASIPAIIALKWWDEERLDVFADDEDTTRRLRRKLNDPDWRHLRTAPGRL